MTENCQEGVKALPKSNCTKPHEIIICVQALF